jgi:hypothetical protein
MSLRKDVATRAVVRRRIAAPRERMFQAWTTAEHLQRWFFPSETVVTVELHEVQGEAEIIVTHEHFPDPTVSERHTIGWNCSLERLTQLVEAVSAGRVLVTQGDACRQ